MTTPSNNLLPRPPIVVVMGHVDHGKTTLLDYIRKTNVASREAGGITQSIGAYEIEHSGRKMTFIDTPGHEAFSKMRSRGATAADLAILVVSADDGVKPQTAESIKILLETETPFVVAITKIDKETANVEKVKSSLAAEGVLLEGYGGSVSFQPVSAKSGDNVNELLDLLLLAADLENLTYDPSAPASGFVIETKMDRRRGLEATVIVTNGTLRHGTPISTKTAQGSVRILEDFTGTVKKELIPSSPALVIGFERLPQVGEEFSAGTMGELLNQTIKGNTTRTVTGANVVPDARPNCLRVIVKASDSGSLEALYEIVKAMAIEKPIQIVGDAVGEVNDNDVKLAISSKAVIIAFRSKTDKTAKALAEANRIDIISSDIIYDLTRSIEENVVRKLTPTSQGELEVLALFNAPKLEKQLIGGKVTHGTLRNKSMFILKREGATPMKGRILSVKQKKQEVSEVAEGNECGIIVSVPVMVAVGDKIIVAHES